MPVGGMKFTRFTQFASGIDSDAQAFISAAGLTNAAHKSAIIQLVSDLKASSLWSKMAAIYPFVGGTGSSHAVNLKNPTLYALTFSTETIHSDGGFRCCLTNTTQATSTALNFDVVDPDNYHISNYFQGASGNITVAPNNTTDVQLSTATYITASYCRNEDANSYFTGSDSAGGSYISYVANGIDNGGLYINRSNSASQFEVFRQNISKGTANKRSVRPTGGSFGVGCNAPNPISWASAGASLTNTEGTNLYNAVVSYQISLSRFSAQ